MDFQARMKAAAAAAAPMAVPLPSDPLRELHIDGDYAAYYFGATDIPLEVAKVNLLNAFSQAAEWSGAGGRKVVHLTSPGSHKGHRMRIARAQDYQANRTGKEHPKNWAGLRAFMEHNLAGLTGFTVKQWMDREADDGCSVAAHYAISQGRQAALYYRDKDFRMIPGLHVTWTKMDRLTVELDTWLKEHDGKVYGRAWFWMQMLQGDRADHIPGLPKVPATTPGKWVNCGEKTAERFIRECACNDMAYFKVAGLYKTFYKDQWAMAFAEQAALLWMRTDGQAHVNNWLQVVPQGARKFFEEACKELEDRR